VENQSDGTAGINWKSNNNAKVLCFFKDKLWFGAVDSVQEI